LRKFNPPALSQRERVKSALTQIGQSHLLQTGVHSLGPIAARYVVKSGLQVHNFADPQAAGCLRRFRQKGDARPSLRMARRLRKHLDFLARGQQAGQVLQQRTLARTVCPHQSVNFARLTLQVNIA
jgi:hypothetical protein